ncbi:unnamed protein product [Ectocarpus sp. 8 AP-2014]
MVRDCMVKAPRLLGCEAAYYFPQDITVCPEKKKAFAVRNERKQLSEENPDNPDDVGFRPRGGLPNTDIEGRDQTTGGSNPQSVNENSPDKEQDTQRTLQVNHDVEQDHGGAGNLVLHVRSGDIFFDRVVPYKGQPPLQFYMLVMQNQPWDRVDIVTNGQNWENVNPVMPALMAKRATGELPDNVYFHTERSMGEDLQDMLCAEALGVAKSSLIHLLGFHSTANRVYYPWRCNDELAELARLRPETEVYGLPLDRTGAYTVYRHWKNTPAQRAEMLGYNLTTAFELCT